MDAAVGRRGALLLFAGLYLLSLGRGFYGSDGEVMFQTAAALAGRHTLALPADPGLPQIVEGRGGRHFSKYDPGMPLLAVPFYAVGDWIGCVNHAHRTHLAALFVLMLPALAAAGALVGILRAGPTPTPLLPLLAAGLATPLWVYARTLFAEAVLACALTWATALIVRPPRRGGLLLAGIAFALGLAARGSLAIFAPALALLIVRAAPDHSPRALAGRLVEFGAGIAPGAALLLWHNALRFGDPLRSGYAGEGFPTPVWRGAAGLLISPDKGALWYAPPLILAVILWPRFRRRSPALADFLGLAWITALLVYGSWWAWGGGWCWGPRFLVPLMPLSCLPLSCLPPRRAWRWAAALLLIAGIAVQVTAVLTDVTPHYAGLAGRRFDADSAAFDPRHAALLFAARRIASGYPEPLAMAHLAGTGLPPTWTVGLPLLLAAMVAAGARMLFRAARRAPTAGSTEIAER